MRACGYAHSVPVVRLFAQARVAAGTSRDVIEADSVSAFLDQAVVRYGSDFAALLPHCRIWVNGADPEAGQVLTETDEVAVLPPVSGGS